MRIFYSSFLFAITTLFIASCTVITSRNQPGNNQTNFPKEMRGTYDFFYPEGFGMGSESLGKVIISKTEMKMDIDDKITVSSLGDSLFLSKIGAHYYLCMGAKPEFSVFQVEIGKKELKFYSMASEIFVDKENLQNYFSDVEEDITYSEDEEGQDSIPTSTFLVTINDSKLENYFKSEIPSKDPFILKKSKKK